MRRWPKKKPVDVSNAPPRPAAAVVDALDVVGAVCALMFLVGLFLWFGPGPALTITGGLGLAVVLAVTWVASQAPKKTGG